MDKFLDTILPVAFLTALVLIIVSGCAPGSEPLTINQQRAAVLKLYSLGADGKRGDGEATGWVAGDNLVVSARHVYMEAEKFGSDVGLLVLPFHLGEGATLDYGLARADVREFTPLPLDCDYRPEMGDRLYTIGYPGAWEQPMYSEGPVAVTNNQMHADRFGGLWVVDLVSKQGMSGAPVFRDGRVVGILVALIRDSAGGPMMGYATIHMGTLVLPISETALCEETI